MKGLARVQGLPGHYGSGWRDEVGVGARPDGRGPLRATPAPLLLPVVVSLARANVVGIDGLMEDPMTDTQINPDELDAEAEMHDLMADADDDAGRQLMAEANRTRAAALRRRAGLAREVAEWLQSRRAAECGHPACFDDDGVWQGCSVRDDE